MLAKSSAFLRRDLALAASYRVAFLQSIAAMVLGLGSINLVSRLIDEGSPTSLEPYGGDYFSYALVGIGIVVFGQAVADMFPGAIRSAQTTGTLEVILGSRTGLPAFLAYSSLFGLLQAGLRLTIGIAVGWLLLGADLRLESAGLAVLVFLLTTLGFAGIGILAAAFVVWCKQREPFTAAFLTGSFLLSGIIYPTQVLPAWLAALADLMPLTHVALLLRSALVAGAAPVSVPLHLLPVIAFSLLLPLGLYCFRLAVRQAQREGTLGHY